ncbi:Glycosyl transferases group 1 [Lachnospiraceae bacterium XBB1006]|nr:Glycosyl transferases group 1 [Lachnospiraceae bacterium XBB1006]
MENMGLERSVGKEDTVDMEKLNSVLQGILELEGKGLIEECIRLFNQLEALVPSEQENLKIEKGKLRFRNGQYEEALLDFSEAYEIEHAPELLDLIFEAYYLPNEKSILQNVENNEKWLQTNPNVYWDGNYDEDLYLLYSTPTRLIGYDKRSDRIIKWEPQKKEVSWEPGVYAVISDGYCSVSEMEAFAEEMIMVARLPLPNMKIGVYYLLDTEELSLLLQCEDLSAMKYQDQIVLIAGMEEFAQFLMEPGNRFPDYAFSNKAKELLDIAVCKSEILKEKYEKAHQACRQYYEQNREAVRKHIRDRCPRVMIQTSVFTSVLQYHARDVQQALQNRGIECELIIEKSTISCCGEELFEQINRFKPDLFFCIDHFRFESLEDILIPYVTWVQDPMKDIIDRNTPGKLTEIDFVLNHFISWKYFLELGYDENRLIPGPIPANSHIYRPMDLTDMEKEQYACDICFVCHASDVEAYLDKLLKAVPEDIREGVASVFAAYRDYVYEFGEIFYSIGEAAAFIRGALERAYGIILDEETLKWLANEMYLWYNQRVFRQVLVDWLVEAGHTNIKLWGKGWMDIPRYAPYAMGPADNGETLSKIYQAAKIVIGNNTATTAAARAWESMLSGTFYLANYVPPEEDYTDIRLILEPAEFVMFKGKEDLLQKVDYYLNHDEERMNMARIGRDAALKKMTFDVTVERLLDELAKRI